MTDSEFGQAAEEDESMCKESPQEVLVELAKKREQARKERLEAEPDTPEEANLSGYERGLRDAVSAFEQLDRFQQSQHLPEWQIGLENEDDEWGWYYPHAVTRERAIEKARQEARDGELGDGRLTPFEVGGPIAQ